MENNIFNRLIKKITNKSTFGKSVLMLAGGTAIAQFLSVAASPIISRLFSPDDFGLLSVYTSILSIVGVFATLRYEFAIPIAEDDETAINLLVLTITSVSIISLTSFALFSFFSDKFAYLINAQQMEPYFWLISVGILASGIYTAFRYWAFRKKDFKTITKTTINQSIAHNAIMIFWGLLVGSPIGLIIGTIVGRSAGIWILSKDIQKNMKVDTRLVTLEKIKNAAKRYIKFPVFSSWAALLNSLGLQLPILLLSSMYGTEVTGSFGFAKKVLAMPMTFLGVAIGEVFFSEASSIVRTNPKRLITLSRILNKKLILIGIFPFTVLTLFGPAIFSFIFGEAWRDAGKYASILSIMLFTGFVTTPISNVFNILERQLLGLAINGFRTCLVLISFYISAILSLNSFQAVALYAISMTIIYLITFLLAQKALIDQSNRIINSER